jgi:hypothetical protein
VASGRWFIERGLSPRHERRTDDPPARRKSAMTIHYPLNRVSTEVSEIAKAEHTMKVTHIALDAV